MKLFIVLLCLFISHALANTEAFYFKIPKDLQFSEDSKSSYKQISIDEITTIKFEVPSPNSQGHSKDWFEIVRGVPGSFHNARFSWSALVRLFSYSSISFLNTNYN